MTGRAGQSWRACRRALLALAVSFCGFAAASAEEVEVDLELVLAVDVSLSMDADEQRLQRDGYVAAFRSPQVLAAIRDGLHGRIAVTYVEWAGAVLQSVRVPWTVIEDAGTASRFADLLAQQNLSRRYRTSISGAARFGARLLEDNGYRGIRRVIDISGDGPNNQGRRVDEARDAIAAKGITINGLPLMLKRRDPGGFFNIDNLDRYYADCVIGGPGAFSLPVYDVAQLAAAIRRKLILEIAGRPALFVPAQASAPEPPADCLIGEKLWRMWIENWQ